MLEVNKKTLWRIFLGVCGCIILFWLLHETERVNTVWGAIKSVIAPFVLGGVLAFVLNVPMRAMENKFLKKISKNGARRVIAVILTFICLLLVLALVFWLLIPQIVDTIESLVPALYTFFTDMHERLMGYLNQHPELLDWLISNTDFENFEWDSIIKDALEGFGDGVSAILSYAVTAVGSIFSAVFNGFIAIAFCVYCLFQKETLARQGRKLLYAFVKERTADNVVRILRLTNSTFSNFLSGQCVEVCILGSMFAVSMAIFGMPYIPLISVVIAVTAFIPIVGAWTGCILGAFLIFVKDPALALWFVAMFIILQQIENNLIYPRIVGTSVGLSGMWVLLAVAIGGAFMGAVGMFLMIPIVSVVHILLREITEKKLAKKAVAVEKLQPQPPVLNSKFKQKREHFKNKRQLKKNSKKSEKTEE